MSTCKLNGIDPQAYLTDVITHIVNDHPNSRIDELLPWAYAAAPALKERGLRTTHTIEVWFQDEMRVGQKNKLTYRWARTARVLEPFTISAPNRPIYSARST